MATVKREVYVFPMKDNKRLLQTIIHISFVAFLIGTLLVIVFKFSNFINGGRLFTSEEIDSASNGETDTELLDFLFPLIVSEENVPVDDGVTKIVFFGNAPFADGRGEDSNVTNLIAELTGAEVYNCAIPGSYLSASNVTFDPDVEPLDAFSFYWLATTFCMDNFQIYDRALAAMPEADPDISESMELLKSIDFETVDIITLMYDASDYLAGREMYNDANFTDPQQFTGSMAAGIELIQSTYPHIRIIVMSPTYAYGLEDDGTYVSSALKTYGWSHLSTYVIKQGEAASELRVSFVDNLYGTVHEDNASNYLTDHLHLNKEGRKLVAKRFVYALNKYSNVVIQ